MKKGLRVARPLALLALVGACSGAASGAPEPSIDALPGRLDGTAWTAVSIAGRSVLPAHEPTIEFDDVGLHGSSGCNEWGALPTFGPGGSLTITEISMTKRACNVVVAGQEAAFVAALRGTTSMATDGTVLQLHGTAGDIVLRPGVGIGG